MRKIYLLLAFLISISVLSQKDYSRYYNSWRLGLNLGGAWQTADYRSCWGIAGGITLEKGFHENSTNFFSFAVRGRYLGANTYGMDYNRNYDVKSNDAYNGKYDSKVNYADSVSIARQYVYDNYKMQLGEGSLELQLTFNRLREQTHILLNLWGGVGFTSYRTKSDLLAGDNKLYDFSLVDSTGNKTKAINSYNGLIDKKYESYAYGSKNGNLITFSPSLGIGLGYQFSPFFSMLWEYKITFPQGMNADLLDGKLAANNDFFGSNDYYHYTGLNLLFTLRGKKKTSTPKNETTYTNTVVPTNPIAPTTSITPPTNTVVSNSPPTQLPAGAVKPLVTFVTPAISGQVINTQPYKVSAQILNISSVNQIQFKFNGAIQYNFTYNLQTHLLEYNGSLNKGNNTVQIIATNKAGQDNKTSIIAYEQQKQMATPVVSYINPIQPGAVSAVAAYQIQAQVLNVTGQNEISVYYNGLSSPFTYNATTKQVIVPVTLNSGSNSISITANNAAGEDTKVTNVIFKNPRVTGTLPVVNLINPSTPLNATDNLLYNFKLSVLHVSNKSGIELLFNNVAQTNFTYDVNTKELFFQTNLMVGNNTVSIKGTNQFGSDSKLINVSYTPHADIKLLPVVTISNPVSITASISTSNYTFKATISNVLNSSGLTVKLNGNTVTNYVYDGLNLTVNSVLNSGANSFEVSGHNNDGTDAKSVSVTYTPRVKIEPVPVITFVNPGTQKSITSTPTANYIFNATISNVESPNSVSAKFNGSTITNFTFDGTIFTYPAVLNQGANSLQISASNANGSDIKIASVNYRPKVLVPRPPIVTILQPTANPTVTTNSYNFIFKAVNVAQNQIEVTLNGSQVTQFSYGNNIGSFTGNLIKEVNTLTVKATNQDGIDSKTETLLFRAPITIDTSKAATTSPTTSTSTATQGGSGTIVICHVAAGSNPQTRTIPVSLLGMHMGHGDTQGACPVAADSIKVIPRPIKTIPVEHNSRGEKSDTTTKQPTITPRKPR
ncbi:MAG: hypothetical protein V4580_12555 [Bacteroidota bacterium]